MYDYRELDKFADGLRERDLAVEVVKAWDGWQVLALDKDGDRIGDAILFSGSFGHKSNLIEIMGFGVNDEEDGDIVVGYLTAKEALCYVDRYLGRK